MGALLDLVLLPPSNAFQANVMGIDGSGQLIYCAQGMVPKAATLPAADPTLENIDAMTIDQGMLYILDKKNNRIWVYVSTDYKYEDAPRLYFDNDVPTLTDVVAIANNNEDMYILHDSGQMTTCTFRQFQGDQTRCTDNAPYGDQRPGRDKNATLAFTEASFAGMQVTRAPDLSLYMLEINSASIYHFSFRLNLQNQFRPDLGEVLPKSKPTAFAVTTARIILVAFNNEVYYGSMP